MLNMHKNGATSDYRATFRRLSGASDYLATTDYPATMAKAQQRLSSYGTGVPATIPRLWSRQQLSTMRGVPCRQEVPLHGQKEAPLGEGGREKAGGRRKAGAAWELPGEWQAGSARGEERAIPRFVRCASKFARFTPFELSACPDMGKNKGPL